MMVKMEVLKPKLNNGKKHISLSASAKVKNHSIDLLLGKSILELQIQESLKQIKNTQFASIP